MTANLLEAVRHEAPAATVVLISSGEIYGPPARLPVDEDAPLRPQNPYAVSKAAVDLLGGQYADATALRVVRLRPFNHAGPGQGDDYVVGTLTRQVAEAEAAGAIRGARAHRQPRLARATSRDVRDVVRAYVAAAGLEPGAYNVASGRAVSVRELIELVRAAARIPVRHEVDPARVRGARRARGARLGGAAARGHRLDARDPARANRRRRPRGLARGARSHAVTAAIAVVVVTHDSAGHIAETLGALTPQLRHDDELIVVDNGSRDATGAAVRAAAPGARLVEQSTTAASRAAPRRAPRWRARRCCCSSTPTPARTRLHRRAAPRGGHAPQVGGVAGAGDDGRRHDHQHRGQRHALPRDGLGRALRAAARRGARRTGGGAVRLGRRAGRAARGLGARRRVRRALLHVRRGPRPLAAALAGRLGRRNRPGGARRARLRLRQGRAQVVPAGAQSLVDDPVRLPRPAAAAARPRAARRGAGAARRGGARGLAAPEAARAGGGGARSAGDARPAARRPVDARDRRRRVRAPAQLRPRQPLPRAARRGGAARGAAARLLGDWSCGRSRS